MLTARQSERYLRHILLKEVGAQGQQKLLTARVLVVGAGGLGAPIIQYLAAAGIGALGIADDDLVSLSNLQRQTIFSIGQVGSLKTRSAREFTARLNEDVDVVEHPIRIDGANAGEIIRGYDVVVEGVDNFETRYALNAACMALRRPLVSAAIGRFEGQLSVFMPWAGPDLPCYRCLVPVAPPRQARLNCAEEGVIGPVAGAIGSLAALEVLKVLLPIGDSLAGKLLTMDALNSSFRIASLKRDPACPDCAALAR